MAVHKDTGAATHFGRQMKKERVPPVGRDPAGFRDWAEIEDKAVQLRAWAPGIVHGLLQTEDYAAALLATSPGASEETIAGRLRARMER